MLSGERKQLSIFGDGWIYSIIIAKFPDHPLVKLRPLVDKLLVDVEKGIGVYYSEGLGRPSWPVGVILKMHLLEYLYNLSDVMVSQAVNCNILFKWFCNLDIDENVPDDTTLVKFRKRLGEGGFTELFSSFIEASKKLGYGKGKLRILDGTHVLSFCGGFGRLGLLRDGIRRVLKRVKEKAILLSEETKRKALHVLKVKGEAKIKEVKEVIERLGRELSEKGDAHIKKILSISKRVARGATKIGSLVDPEARWGHKSEDFAFFGYKVHLCCDENGFVTNLEALSGERNEGNRLEAMLKGEVKRRGVEGVIADALYDSVDNRKYCKGAEIKAYIPPRTKGSEVDKFELEGEKVECPAGKYSIGRIEQERGFLYYFSAHDCKMCKCFKKCVSPGEVRKKVYLSECKRLREEDYREKMKTRAVIERANGWAKRWLGLSRARYLGTGKMLVQAILTFMAMNLKIMIRGPCLGRV